MTLVHELDLDIVKMYQHAKNEVSRSRHSKVRVRTDTHKHTHRQTDTSENSTFPLSRSVIIHYFDISVK